MKNKHPDELIVALVQHDIIWEDKESNLTHYTQLIDVIKEEHPVIDLVVLPEMFTTGFTMNPAPNAETMEDATIEWMKELAAEMEFAICGSLIINENGAYHNRFVFITQEQEIYTYDKRHLFAYAGEDAQYTAGNAKVQIPYKGWNISPFICYDLRFPVWCRNTGDTDVMLFVANWPEIRIQHWNTLLAARAIENQCYTIGVNRIGTDSNNLNYVGSSAVYHPSGATICQMPHHSGYKVVRLHKSELDAYREKLPFLKDADTFKID